MPGQHKRRVARLHAIDPRCRRCGKTTFLQQEKREVGHPDVASLQHRFHRGDPRRTANEYTPNESRTTLYCRACNQQDAKDVKHNKMRTLSIDIETYSSNDIRSGGVYKYIEAPDFAILMLAYAFDDEPVRIVDIASGEELPIEVADAMQYDHTVRLCAHNAAFERACINKFFNMDTAPERWHCTMVHAAMLGLPMKLETVAQVLGQEQQKDSEGKSLINYFSKPCKPTKTNGQRTRNMPEHDFEKWEKFKNYCMQDVVVERDIRRSIEWYKIPDIEREIWCEDQRINDAGVQLDLPFVHQVIKADRKYRAELTQEAIELTGLDNPNSVTKLSTWLSDALDLTVADLRKDTVNTMLGGLPEGKAKRILEIRQEMSKTSIKKYDAMLKCVCADGRARGLLQYYGAQRTGRAAGRLIQVQNLPRISTDTIDIARNYFVNGEVDVMECMYESLPNMLSQFVRTAFVAAPGKRFIVVDFSAIEARVIAWLANEEWRLEVFRTHGKIYEASAAQMFRVPIETIAKGKENYALRQKGKVAELACIAKGQLVLTHVGLIPIEDVVTRHLLWDGQRWVQHEGIISKGFKKVITYDGLTATGDHLVYIEGSRFPVHFEFAAASGKNLARSGNGRNPIRLGEDNKPREKVHARLASTDGADAVRGVQSNSVDQLPQPDEREIQRVSGVFPTETSTEMAGPQTDSGESPLRKSKRSGLSKLRRTWNTVQLFFGIGSRSVDNRELGSSRPGDGVGPEKQQRSLRAGEHSVDYAEDEQVKPTSNNTTYLGGNGMALRPDCGGALHERWSDPRTDNSKGGERGSEQTKELARDSGEIEVFDIVNAGSNHRFTVADRLVHNCGYGGGPGALIAMGALNMGLKEEELKPIIDAWRNANPAIKRLWYNVQDAAIKAVETGQCLALKPGLKFQVKNNILFVQLPSGRRLAYQRPTLREGAFGMELVYEEVVRTKAAGWGKEKTYGGKLVENITQAVARDCLMHALLRVTKAGYKVVMHVHDELVLEAPEGFGSLEEVERIMAEPLPWAPGLPLGADGFESKYYKK